MKFCGNMGQEVDGGRHSPYILCLSDARQKPSVIATTARQHPGGSFAFVGPTRLRSQRPSRLERAHPIIGPILPVVAMATNPTGSCGHQMAIAIAFMAWARKWVHHAGVLELIQAI